MLFVTVFPLFDLLVTFDVVDCTVKRPTCTGSVVVAFLPLLSVLCDVFDDDDATVVVAERAVKRPTFATGSSTFEILVDLLELLLTAFEDVFNVVVVTAERAVKRPTFATGSSTVELLLVLLLLLELLLSIERAVNDLLSLLVLRLLIYY